MIELKCDATGETLEKDGKRLKGYLTLKGGLAFQHPEGGFDYLGERFRVYAFADEDSLADWVEKEVVAAEIKYAEEGPHWTRIPEENDYRAGVSKTDV